MGINLEDIERKQKERLAILSFVYEQTELKDRGSVLRKELDDCAFLPDHQLSYQQLTRCLLYLQEQKLITLQGTESMVRLTHMGVSEVETALQFPGFRTQHFMGSVTNVFYGSAYLQQGTNHTQAFNTTPGIHSVPETSEGADNHGKK
ncbi:hypothetical protein [Deinococcus cellulosilyticus]|uniref:Uncharacterized protein n=1 Tax=Deinococcus cellulosilyticus (strain DSM 18568 / NBRC 106333 / KACC 11606 / 5516J-15) TaxID=1223518 RepID=A0A511NAZ0_DEIC1|nr:hypothetical protein [Deinococcus cellulosilyticus]GEM49989.1 hypothetical protein DC3_56240 [Deinococcus cellulosilyticus NBRC 106333 = KACC 11606]